MSTLKQDRKHVRDKELGRHNDQKYKEALKTIAELEREVNAYQVLSEAPHKRVIRKQRIRKGASRATVISFASDWHVAEIVKPSTVQYLNKYNPDIAERRAKNYWRKLVDMTNRQRHDTTIETLCLVLAGDFITGHIHSELAELTAMAPLEELVFAQSLLDAGIRYVKEHGDFKRIVVICKDGNHGRMGYDGSKTRHATRAGHSLEWAMYQTLAKLHPDLEWVIDESYLTYYDIYGYTIRTHHGDMVRYNGGVGGLEVPMKRAYMQWNLTKHADINIMGHWHTYLPGYNTVNGSLIGYNAYAAQVVRANHQPPLQAFIVLDQDKGITTHAPLLVE